MFNVCAGCGEYTIEKRIDRARQIAACPSCDFEQAFKLSPLFIITGASCSGKTTVLQQISSRLEEVVCLDADILWCDQFNDPTDDFRAFRNTWLRMAKNIAQSGRPVALFGSATPGQFEACVERRYIGDIHYLAFVCEPDELERRLRARPAWRQSGSDETVRNMLGFNEWLRTNACDKNMAVINTTNMSVEETITRTIDWIRARF